MPDMYSFATMEAPKGGEAGFLLECKKATQALADVQLAPQATVEPQLTEAHWAEIRFNEKKVDTARIEALLANHLTPSEITPQLLAEAEEHLKKLAKNQRERTRDTKRVRCLVTKSAVNVEGAHVWSVAPASVDLARAGVVQASSPAATDIIMMNDPANAPMHLLFTAGLVGATIATPQYVETGGQIGAALAFQPAVKVKRWVYVSCGFITHSPQAAESLHEVLLHRRAGCSWNLLGDVAGLAATAQRRAPREVLVFLGPEEVDEDNYNFVTHRLTLEAAVGHDFVVKLNAANCRTGVCLTH